jgi:hypothetical protein
MKYFFFLFVSLCSFAANAQTPLISHKSHSGASHAYLIASSSNFGAIHLGKPNDEKISDYARERREVFVPLNDSVVIKRTFVPDPEGIVFESDTLPNKNKYAVPVFRQKYQDSIRQIRQEEGKFLYKEQQPDKQMQNTEPVVVPAKKKKKSYLLFLFGITGGGMMLIKLFSKSGNTTPSIA